MKIWVVHKKGSRVRETLDDFRIFPHHLLQRIQVFLGITSSSAKNIVEVDNHVVDNFSDLSYLLLVISST